MKKRAQGLSLNTIVLAVLALLVLVVIIVIFSGQIGTVSKGFTNAQNSTNLCRIGFLGEQECRIDCGNNWNEVPDKFCEDSKKTCCQKT